MGRRKKSESEPTAITPLTKSEISDLANSLGNDYPKVEKAHHFLPAFKLLAQSSLYVFCKHVLGMRDLTDRLHKPACEFVQDMKLSRRKLMMLPVVHLKTSICSQGFPLHALIQPIENNIYFQGWAGCDLRILLNGESRDKAMENLKVIKGHLESNRVLRALWPTVCWDDPNKQAGVWKDDQIVVRRQKIVGEPSVTAIGVGTKLHGRHYDIIVADDLATLDAAQSEIIMERARLHRKALRSRLDNLSKSIELGVGTHWTALDIYTDWKRDPSVAVMIRSAIEDGKPIWPERHSLDSLLALQAEEGMGSVLFSANYMNNPLSKTFTALDWGEVRMFEVKGDRICFAQQESDQGFLERSVADGSFTSAHWTRRSEFTRGIPLERLYPSKFAPDESDPLRVEQMKLAAIQRRRDAALEGSQTWQRMEEFYERGRINLQRLGRVVP